MLEIAPINSEDPAPDHEPTAEPLDGGRSRAPYSSEEKRQILSRVTEAQELLAAAGTADGEDLDRLMSQARDEFGEVAKITYAKTYTVARRLTTSDETAEDAVQETYMRAWRSLQKFNHDSEFTAWLFRIAVNTTHNHRDKNHRHRHEPIEVYEERSEVAIDGGQEEAVIAGDLRSKVALGLERLTQKERKVLVLVEVYGMSHGEVVEHLGLRTEEASKLRLFRARKRLRKVLEEMGAFSKDTN